MLNQSLESIRLAWRDWLFEYPLSICSVIALASMLAPLLILVGLENGIITGMKSRLLEDPSILIITPKSDAGKFSASFIKGLAELPGARFAIGRTRETSTDLTLVNLSTNKHASIALEPAASGEPVLEHAGITAPTYGKQPEIALSLPAALALNAKPGNLLEGKLGRRTPAGKLESEIIKLKVTAIMPAISADRKMAFVPLKLLEDIENYRDYIAVPDRGYTGDVAPAERQYASFRLYAKSLENVENLVSHLQNLKIETTSRTRDIAAIRLLKSAIDKIIFIISLAVGSGFVAFTVSSALSTASRKKKILGMLRLLGFRGKPLILYPVTQTIITGITGFILSLGIYLCVSLAISHAFTEQGNLTCTLSWVEIGIALVAVILLSAISCIKTAILAASAEPSMVIREI